MREGDVRERGRGRARVEARYAGRPVTVVALRAALRAAR
jgi:hypothetical protein